jgi:hypothetical protein
VRTHRQISNRTSNRLAWRLLAAAAVPALTLALLGTPRAVPRLVSPAVQLPAAATAVPPSRSDSHAAGTGVPDASAVFSGRDAPLEEPAPTF